MTSGTDSGILIVDDDPGAIRALRRALVAYSDVRFATTGSDAVRLAHERLPDVVLMDAEMPDGNGFEACRRFKESDILREVPVIFVTAHDDVAFEARALEVGAADFLPKPISAPRVQMRVRLHLQLKKQMDELRALSRTDGLTKLPNRRAFDETLVRECRRAVRTTHPISLVMLDVDHFKAYNDTYGHPAGDTCLRAVARVVERAARRATDFPSRIGGEEFALLLADTPPDAAHRIAQALRASVAAANLEHRASKVAPHVTVSVGVACLDSVFLGPDGAAKTTDSWRRRALLEAADRALYLAKAGGRNRVESFDVGGVHVPMESIPVSARPVDGSPQSDGGVALDLSAPPRPSELSTLRAAKVPAEEPSPAPTSQWPPVDGINTHDAFVRLGGEVRLFRSMLQLLQKELIEFEDWEASAAADDARWMARAHKLRGTAGNIGALDLHRAARDVEETLRTGAAASPHMLEHMTREAVRLRAGIEVALAPSQRISVRVPKMPPTPLDVERVAELLQQLRAQDFSATKAFEEIAPTLEKQLPAGEFRALSAALGELRFGDALRALSAIVPVE